MGMILSKYSMLNSLGYKENNQISRTTKKVLRRYKLFGIILHDPKTHKDFDEKLDMLFERLDYVTGSDFLFFTFLNPKPEWMRRNPDRDYFNIWSKKELASPRNGYSGIDSSLTCYGIAKALEIDYDDLPVIILTNNFQLNQFQQLKTCSNHLEEQMQEIGFFCSQKSNLFSLANDSDLDLLLKKIDKCDGYELKTINHSLAKSVSDFLAFLIDRDSKDYRVAKRQITDVINRFVSNKAFERDPKKLESLNLFMLSAISNIKNNRNQIADFPIADFPIQGLEPESKIIYQTYRYLSENFDGLSYKLRKKLKYNDRESRYLRRHREQIDFIYARIDFTPLTIALCKIFEIEINLSLVHWIRRHLKIEMPDYYKKRKIDNNSYSILPSENLVNRPRPIDFNKGRKNKWIAPGIGESELIAKTLKMNADEFKEIINLDLLLPEWSIIRKNRNEAAHTYPISKSKYEEVNLSFNRLIENNLFSNLIAIKNELKTTANK